MLEKKEVFETRVRERAFQLWQEAGCPKDEAETFWHRARAFELSELNLTPQELEKADRESPVSDAADFA